MVGLTAADTIRILVATDNHVGYNERDAVRGDDSWKAFDEIMSLAKARDVDMVLLAGDLFHDNQPSRKSMYKVMRSLRANCYGEKPCELQLLSDPSENFQNYEGSFNHANYEDEDINVAIPVFSIHGNHDDPSGHGPLAALDLLQVSGLVNYYGRTTEVDNVQVKPVLLQKGRTKLALYGMSNIRDERLFRTFRDGKVKFFQPSTQKSEWFNLLSVHQNHAAHTDTGYLPENFLPDFMDLVVWGHEHECLINPRYNPEMSFHVMQPGSSVATSLMPGEAVTKHVAILSVTGKEFKSESIRLKNVRPFVMRDIVLQDDRKMKAAAMKDENKLEITRYLQGIVEELIKEGHQMYDEAHADDPDLEGMSPEDLQKARLPLVRLRVDYTAPEGGKFDCENPQRFSNRFQDKVANVNDVILFQRKKTGTVKRAAGQPDMPAETIMAQMSMDSVKVEKLVREFLSAQSLTILPQNSFGDAVSQYVDKDDNHAMETFVSESLHNQVGNLLQIDGGDEDELEKAMAAQKAKLEELFDKGAMKRPTKRKLKPKPADWETDVDGNWSDEPAAIYRSDDEESGQEEEEEEDDDGATKKKPASARGRGKATGTTRKPAATKAAPKTGASRGKKKAPSPEEEEEQDVVMIDDDDEEDGGDSLFLNSKSKKAPASSKAAPKRAASPKKRAPARSTASQAAAKQTTLSFGSPQHKPEGKATGGRAARMREPSDDEIDDDDDAFEPPPATGRSTRGRK